MPEKIDFAFLHCHTKYSIQDAMPTSVDYVKAVYDTNQASTKYNVVGTAITDHGVVYGIVDHYRACEEPDIEERKTKPIYGVEVYHCVDVNNNPNNDRFHLVLLAKNETGLRNIYKIVSHAGNHLYVGRSKTFPITDINYLKQHGEGIIALSACIGGIIPKCIIAGEMDQAAKYALTFQNVFDEFYLEVQPNEIPEQLIVNHEMVELSAKYNIPLVMTSDSHYINASDKRYHDILKDICHQVHFSVSAHLHTPEEMEEYCIKYNIPLSAISNTGHIANQCDVMLKPKNNRELLPVFPCPKGYTENSYLREKAFEMLSEKLIKNNIDNPVKYIKQMLYELEIICNAGYAGYFLILWDWFDWCRRNGILTGPGRGSAAGSIISYALNITKVDPIKNGFVFERFLNPGRLSFPDVDSDIPRSKRADAIAYLQNRYGIEKVAQIITFGKYKLKNTTKALMSALGCTFQEANEITKPIPDLIDGKEVTYELIEGVATDPDNDKYVNFTEMEKNQLKKIYKSYQDLFNKYPTVYDGIKKICGCLSGTGIHAGGVIICNKNISENMGITAPTGAAVTSIIQIEMNDLEFFGFLKIDVLGLSTLDVIKKAMDLIGLDYDWYDSEDYNDPLVYEMLRNGETTDVFQMASFNATKMLADFKTDSIEVASAVNAGNRPGPLEKDKVTGKSMVDLYQERRQTGIVPSIDPRIDPLLKNTFGCIWYQEDCMQLGRVMAGYDMGGADSRIRTVLGKKKLKMIPEIRNEFLYGKASVFNDKHEVVAMSEEDSKWCTGAIAHGFTEQIATQIFDNMEAFAKYSFNKSHSFCYAVIAYKTAWLSKYYPVEFAIANCTVNEEEEKIVATLALAKKRKIPIFGPDINNSQSDFSYELSGTTECIRYGLKAIKNVGKTAIDFINQYRSLDKVPFKDFDDFYDRMHVNNSVAERLINLMRAETGKNSPNPMKKSVEMSLILAGAFDYCEPNRYKLLNHYLVDIRKEKEVKIDDEIHQLPLDEKSFTRKIKLALEKTYMGTYISEHPLDSFPYVDLDSCQDKEDVQIAGICVQATIKETKRKTKFISIKIKDKTDIERTINLFDETKALELKKQIKKNSILIVKGTLSKAFNNITASSVKIAAAKKQSVDTEDMVIEEKTSVMPTYTSVYQEDPLASIF